MTTVRPATSSDVGRVARTASRAFADDPVRRWLVPDDDEHEANHQAMFGNVARRWLVPDDDEHKANHQAMFGNVARRWLATDSLWCTDDVAAMAGWVPPGRPEVEPDGLVEMAHPEWRRARRRGRHDRPRRSPLLPDPTRELVTP